jgi:hypothetical protein
MLLCGTKANNMNAVKLTSVKQLTVKQIDELISQLEYGCIFLLHELHDLPKTKKLSNIIGYLIDLRCEKLGIKL